jgi:hypothetical protein
MLADFPVLYVDAIVRRTIVSCGAVAVIALVAAVLLGQPLAGVGAVLGSAAAIGNHRMFQISTARYSKPDGHMDRKPYAGSVAGRLGGITLVAFALLFFLRPMGFGMIGGLIVFQLLLMANALRSAMAVPDGSIGRSGAPAVTARADPGRGQAQARSAKPSSLGTVRAQARLKPMISTALLAVAPIPVGDHVKSSMSSASPSTQTRSGPP